MQGVLRKERQERFNTLKSAPCKDCGRYFHPFAMDFDHINPDKKDSNVGRLVWGLTPWDKVLAEIEKCDLVCANCHRLRTYKGGFVSLSIDYDLLNAISTITSKLLQ